MYSIQKVDEGEGKIVEDNHAHQKEEKNINSHTPNTVDMLKKLQRFPVCKLSMSLKYFLPTFFIFIF